MMADQVIAELLASIARLLDDDDDELSRAFPNMTDTLTVIYEPNESPPHVAIDGTGDGRVYYITVTSDPE